MTEMAKDIEGIKADLVAQMSGATRDKTWAAVDAIAANLRPGMTEADAIKMANRLMAEQGVRKFWHRTHVRFGSSTVLSFDDGYADGVVLKEDDIANIDIGPIWDGIEGDCGRAVVFGNDPKKHKIASDVKIVFDMVQNAWRNEKLSGNALMEFASQTAVKLGYVLQPTYVKGHRLSEFPHSFYTTETLFDFPAVPQPKRWILEIHICKPDMSYGAFYEDLLM